MCHILETISLYLTDILKYLFYDHGTNSLFIKKPKNGFLVSFTQENEVKLKIAGCHGNHDPIKEILYQSVFGHKCYTMGHKFTISVTMGVSPFAWCLARAVLNL